MLTLAFMAFTWLRHPTAATAAVSLALLSSVSASAAAATHDRSQCAPRPGSPGLGDRLFPTLGNGGYDVLHYDLNVRYVNARPSSPIDGTVTLKAVTTQDLSRFNLDFGGDAVGGVKVNGRKASFRRHGDELVITPTRALRKGQVFSVTVSHFTARPVKSKTGEQLSVPFFVTADGSATGGQPNAMHKVFPSNDHPRDKASFTIALNVPKGRTAVANGQLQSKKTHQGRTTWTYRQRQPMATELTQLVVGDYTVVNRGRAHGVRVRDVIPTRLVKKYKPIVAVAQSQIGWMEKRLTQYPFDVYGSLLVDAEVVLALETQTLSIYDVSGWSMFPRSIWEPVMNHELAHQWFGNDVSPYEWSDVWLNEGHATWYENTYAADKGYLKGTFTGYMKAQYAQANQLRADHGPVAQPVSGAFEDVFSPNAYGGGALVLYALRQKIGAAKFASLEKAWVTKYSGRSASTADFVALASKTSGQDLSVFLKDWLYGTKVPPMPGHPDWVAAATKTGS